VKAETRIPQLDGPSASSRESSISSEGSPSPPAKTVPLPSLKVESNANLDDEAVIGSDLDDSDDDDNLAGGSDDPVGGAKDIVFCTYDKASSLQVFRRSLVLTRSVLQVQRVKNKWKCVLKDGMVHLNGKDYLFSKCTGCVIRLPGIDLFIHLPSLGNSNGKQIQSPLHILCITPSFSSFLVSFLIPYCTSLYAKTIFGILGIKTCEIFHPKIYAHAKQNSPLELR
jgi:hypothetical protein